MYFRAAAVAAVLLLWWLLGPVVLLLAAAALGVRRIRDRLRPERPWRSAGIGVAAAAVLAGLVVVVPDGWLPIPQGSGRWVTPGYVGRPAIARPVTGIDVPQHPHLAPQGTSAAHNDAWASGTYTWAGPKGEGLDVDSAWFGAEGCRDLAVDSHDRLVALCGDPDAPDLRVLDPDSLRPQATADLPAPAEVADPVPGRDLCGQDLYLDEQDRAVLATADRRILVFATADAEGDPDLTIAESHDVTDAVPETDCIAALLPDWDGRIWFATAGGVIGAVDPATGRTRTTDVEEQVANALTADEAGVYAVSTDAVYRLAADRSGQPRVVWRQQYDRGSEQKPGQLSQGSGTPATLLPGGLLAIADNAEPRMHVVLLRRDTGEEVCEAPVFDEDESATQSALVAVGTGVVVENNHGYGGPASTALGRTTSPGLARVDVVDGECEVTWTSDVSAPSSSPKLSLATGLLYTYTKRSSWWGASAWYLTAIDVHTGRHVFSVRSGTGPLLDSDHAAVTLAPDGSAYVSTIGGLVRVRDRS